MRLAGYVARYGVESVGLPAVEVVQRGAFDAALLDGRDILALADHDRARVLGRTSSGTLRLDDQPDGLHFELDLPATSDGRNIGILAERGDLGGVSFGFGMGASRWVDFEGRRYLVSADLREVSIVSAWPAYPSGVSASRPVRRWLTDVGLAR